MSTITAFVFNKNYDDKEQVRPFMEGYVSRRAELESAGQYPYNDSFKGHIPGIEGASEDTAIYLLQTLFELDALDERVAAFLADGGREVTEGNETLRGTVVHYGFYMGGTGWTEWHNARLLFRNGKPYAVLPKGRRTNGNSVGSANILFKSEVVG